MVDVCIFYLHGGLSTFYRQILNRKRIQCLMKPMNCFSSTDRFHLLTHDVFPAISSLTLLASCEIFFFVQFIRFNSLTDERLLS
jgi:hypothetical protein